MFLALLSCNTTAILGDGEPTVWATTAPTAGSTISVTTDTGAPPTTEPCPLFIAEHEAVSTILEVTWTQDADAEVWLEATFDDAVRGSPARAVSAGEASEVLLGLPPETDVSVALVDAAGERARCDARTGTLPAELPLPSLVEWDPTLASEEEFVLISVDTHENGYYYSGPYYVLLLDRQARVVWYHEVSSSEATMFPHVSADGTHLLFDESTSYNYSGEIPQLRRLTLDHRLDETVDVEGFTYGYTELPDGKLLRDFRSGNTYSLVEQSTDGEIREIWSCNDWMSAHREGGMCYTNAVIWNEQTESVLWSLPYHDTVVEIDRMSGTVKRVFGALGATHETVPEDAAFEFNHYPNFTPEGTLLLSTHAGPDGGEQRAREYEIDDEAGTLTQVWVYGEGIDEYAYYSGEAYRLGNGNTLINYGTGGAAREVTPAGVVAWDITWDEWYLTGHSSLVSDLYALNEGWE